MDEYEDAAHDIGQGIRNLRDLIDAERERQEAIGGEGTQNSQGPNSVNSASQNLTR